MPKRIALKDFVEFDNVTLSNFVRSVSYTSEDAQIDASGFNNTGASEFLSGIRTDQVQVEVLMSRGSNEVHQVLEPLHRNRSTFYFRWRADGSSSVSATNPELRGNVILPTWAEGATRGDLETATLTLVAADSTGLVFYAT